MDDICDETNLDAYISNLDVLDDATKNDDFKNRASFFGATGFTESGLTGLAFEDEPQIDLPSTLEYLRENVDGTGLNMANQLLGSLAQVLRKGRLGLFVTYPDRVGDASVADQSAGNAVATIHAIEAQRVINWWHITNGAKTILGGVVFTDILYVRDGFDVEEKDILRTLTIEDGVFIDRKWQQAAGKSKWEVIPGSEFTPLDGTGKPWVEIPFIFVGARDNTWEIDAAPLYSLAKKNADHLNNSAINEEGIWFSGHLQPVADEMDSGALDVLLAANGGKGFTLGSGKMIVAKGFHFAVAEPNSAARQGMIDKVEDMKGIGARILQPGTVAKTAQQDAGEQKVQHSVLSLAVVNLEDAFNNALRWTTQYMNAPEATVTLSRKFMQPSVTAEMIDRLISLFDRGLAGTAEVYDVLSRASIIDDEKTAEDYDEDVAERGGMEPPVDADA